MYTSTQDFTLACASGSTGATVVRSAVATSIISQRDAYLKAYGLAKALAVEFLECTLDPGPATTIYYNVSKTSSVDNQAGYATETFTVTVPAGAIYSTVSQAEADTAAQALALAEATHARDIGQRKIYYNVEYVVSGSCTAAYLPYSTTITVAAGTYSSYVSVVLANSLAQSAGDTALASALSANCVPVFHSVAVTESAVCSGGLVGANVTVNYPAGQVTETSSQSAVNSLAHSGAKSVAVATIVCVSGYYNVSKLATANCSALFGPCWAGGGPTGAVSAGVYFASTQSSADSTAQSAAQSMANANIHCGYIC